MTNNAPTPPIPIAVGVLIRADGKVLLSKRRMDAPQGGLWEFPGGKREANESLVETLQRELQEELGIRIQHYRPLIQITQSYAEYRVRLNVYQISSWLGEPRGQEGQAIQWTSTDKLAEYPMPVGNKPIRNAIQLPDRYIITPAQINDPNVFLHNLRSMLEQANPGMLQFRVFGLDSHQYHTLMPQVQMLCDQANTPFMLNADARTAKQAGAQGLHLSSRQLSKHRERPAGFTWVAASCHTAQDLQQAQTIGVDFAVLSPVMPTLSHPDAEPLGWEQFRQRVESATIPVYALGGMHDALMQQAWQAGAQGIAGIRGLWPVSGLS